jgi:hypothetical protein
VLKERKREIILGALLVAIAIALWHNLGGDSTTSEGGGSRGGPMVRVNLDSIKLPDVNWAALQAPRPAYDPSGRNIFTYGVIVPPPPPPMTAAEKKAIEDAQKAAAVEREKQEQLMREADARRAQEVQAQQVALANATPTPPPQPQPPPINYKFIGYFGPSENKIAILHDGTDLLFVRQGEKVGDQFKILEIGYESIKFGYTDPRFKAETTTLPMSSSY